MLNIQENVPLAPMTSFRIGGNARYYVEVKTIEELKEALGFAKEHNLDFYVLGGGTNLLVSDAGFDGVMIRMKMNEIKIEGTTLEVEAGVPLIKAINSAAAAGLSGLETLAGIPGTIGGAVRGNAGAYGSEICTSVKLVKAYDVNEECEKIFEGNICDFTYRSSIFKKNKNLIVFSVVLELIPGNIHEIQEKN